MSSRSLKSVEQKRQYEQGLLEPIGDGGLVDRFVGSVHNWKLAKSGRAISGSQGSFPTREPTPTWCHADTAERPTAENIVRMFETLTQL